MLGASETNKISNFHPPPSNMQAKKKSNLVANILKQLMNTLTD